ncbi:hypothetical protein DM46_1443 [Burkholderia mallei]|nr:hypothetical protein DM46_1443 [Burkholderia mallei]
MSQIRVDSASLSPSNNQTSTRGAVLDRLR